MNNKIATILAIGMMLLNNCTVWAEKPPQVAQVTKISQLPATRPLTEQEMVEYALALEPRDIPTVKGISDTVAKGVPKVLQDFDAMIARFANRGMDVSKERAELDHLAVQCKTLTPQDTQTEQKLYVTVRLAKRRLFLRDPDLAVLERVVFVKRHPFNASHNYTEHMDGLGKPGGGVYVLEMPFRDGRLQPGEGKVHQLFDAGQGVVRDVKPDFSAKRIYFAYKKTVRDYNHLMVINADGGNLQQLTSGPWHDLYPCPLPDGDLAFVTTRCKSRFLCFHPAAYTLFRMGLDGSNMHALSFSNLSEWGPTVMRDGRILWTRSEYLDKNACYGHNLWAIYPDGTATEVIFGSNTKHAYYCASEVPGTGEICAVLGGHENDLQGSLALIDVQRSRFNSSVIQVLTPEVKTSATRFNSSTKCFRDPVPISRDLMIVSHAPEHVFGIFAVDRYGNREILSLDPAIGSLCPVPLRSTPTPPILASILPEPTTGKEERGQFLVADVYQGLTTNVARGLVKYLRVCEEVRSNLRQLPNGDYQQTYNGYAMYTVPMHLKGPSGWPTYVAKTSYGIAPVEEDGSANFYAPAGKVLYFEALDANFTEIQRMRSVIQLQPGERRGCVGCHEDRSMTSTVTTRNAFRRAASVLEPPPWGAVPFSYASVVQPVLNARCIKCHDTNHKQKIDLTDTLGQIDRVPTSYRTIITSGLVNYFDCTHQLSPRKAEPLTFGTTKSKLIQVLERGHHEVKLSRDEMHAIKCWIDLNCPLWSDYNNERTMERKNVASMSSPK